MKPPSELERAASDEPAVVEVRSVSFAPEVSTVSANPALFSEVSAMPQSLPEPESIRDELDSVSQRSVRSPSLITSVVENLSTGFPSYPYDDGEEGTASFTPGPRKKLRPWQIFLKRCLHCKASRVVIVVCLLFALFGWTVVILVDAPDEPTNVIVDTTMFVVLCIFMLELIARFATERCVYPKSFFICMDLVGTASMVFEISWLLGEAGQIDSVDSSVNAFFLRTTRAARLGARAGRLAKVMRCFTVAHDLRLDAQRRPGNIEAKLLGKKLRENLSAKVSMLTIVLVLGVPLFGIGRYPEEDLSMRAYSRRLEVAYAMAAESPASSPGTNTSSLFSVTVEDMISFYSDLSYLPFRLEGYPADLTLPSGDIVYIPGEGLLSGVAPQRTENTLRQVIQACQLDRPGCAGSRRAAIFFDFTEAKQYAAGLDIAVVLFIILCMVLESYDLSRTLDAMAVKPMDKMLAVVTRIASTLRQAQPGADPSEPSDALTHSTSFRTSMRMDGVLLEQTFRKLAVLTTVFLQDNIIATEDMKDLDPESKGVIADIMQMPESQPDRRGVPMMSRPSQRLKYGLPGLVSEIHMDPEELDSWGLDILGMQMEQQVKVVMFVLFDSSIGIKTGNQWAEIAHFTRFVESVRTGYYDNPYHNFTHACDVVVSLYRMLQTLQWSKWLSEIDVYSLLVSALCHDIGHPGKTNPFLVETHHELSLRYNDKSPLENMHCAYLFELCKDPSKNVFSLFEQPDYKRARNVCISAILATDNAKHFDMVKEIKKCYQVNSTVCDQQARDPEDFRDNYMSEVLCKDTILWMKMLLHLADISNPLKPFTTYRQWASRVLEEFFAQGDEEKRLGIPVGMLNDREKVSMPGSEHGFINFLVAPLVTSALRIFPTMLPRAQTMVNNMEEWRDLWVEEAHPSQEDKGKRDADIRAIKDNVDQLANTQRPPTACAGDETPDNLSVRLGHAPWKRTMSAGSTPAGNHLSVPNGDEGPVVRTTIKRISRNLKSGLDSSI